MPKRKRDDEDDSGRGTAKAKRVEEKIFHGKKVLQRALKIAKGFERQKLGRRQKTALKEGKQDEKARIDAEIEALKNLSLVACAEIHLYKTLFKQKDFAASSTIPEPVQKIIQTPRDAATMNVSARLFNSNPVKEALKEAIPAIRAASGLEDKGAGNGKKSAIAVRPGRGRSHTQEDSASDDEAVGQPNGRPAKTASGKPGRIPHDESDDPSEEDIMMDSNGEDFADLDDRVAGSSSDDDEEGDNDDGARGLDAFFRESSDELKAIKGRRSTYSEQGSLSPSEGSPEPAPRRAPQRPSSNFLPSLTVGGYVSGSDSEAEEVEELAAPRKNRRGQRARQAIWEKKYGHKAKHVEAGKTAGAEKRDAGWDSQRGAQTQGGDGGRGGYKPRWQQDRESRRKQGDDTASGGNAMALGSREKAAKAKADAEKPLHPSWEAAKKAKEAMQQTAAFTGKKMTFD